MKSKVAAVGASTPAIVLRPATIHDIPTLNRWDTEPHVISASSDNPDAKIAFGEHSWEAELAMQTEHYRYYMAELDGQPIGAMQICDPHLEHTHYWGDIEPHQRALDIWIGETRHHGKGYGEVMMNQALAICFADVRVTTVLIDPLRSNTRAHKFYQRLGFVPTHQQFFGPDDCLVHRMTREEWQSRNG